MSIESSKFHHKWAENIPISNHHRILHALVQPLIQGPFSNRRGREFVSVKNKHAFFVLLGGPISQLIHHMLWRMPHICKRLAQLRILLLIDQ